MEIRIKLSIPNKNQIKSCNQDFHRHYNSVNYHGHNDNILKIKDAKLFSVSILGKILDFRSKMIK